MSDDTLCIAVKDPKDGRCYKATVTVAFAEKHNNYCLVSIGWVVDEDLPRKAFEWLRARGRLKEVTSDERNHMGCQSACVRRGAKECRW